MRNKKWMAATLAGCVTVVFSASVGFALANGAFATVSTYPGSGPGPVQPASPPVNCSAWLRWYAVSGTPAILEWKLVQGNSLAACSAAVSTYQSQGWVLSPGNSSGCICAEPSLALIVDHGGYGVVSNWDSAKDAALNVKLQALREEFRIDEYYQRVNEVVNQDLSAATP